METGKTKPDGPIKRQKSGKLIQLVGYGEGFEHIQVVSVPEMKSPNPSTGSVCVSMEACGVNFADIYTRLGVIPLKQFPFIMGIEGAGIVTHTGKDVQRVKVGDRVLCYTGTGGLYNQQVEIPERNCFQLPEQMSFIQGAAFPATYMTAFLSLFRVGNLRPGTRILIHSAAGGVGCAATQIAKTVKGVEVIGTSSISKHEFLSHIGVDHCLEYEDYEKEVRRLYPDGIDIVLDSLGGDDTNISMNLLRPLGTLVMIGAKGMVVHDKIVNIPPPTISPLDMMMSSRKFGGLHLERYLSEDPLRFKSDMEELIQLYLEHDIKVQIDSILPFKDVVEAYKKISSRKNVGKIVLLA